MLKTYNEFLNERVAPGKLTVGLKVGAKGAGVPVRILKQLIRFKKRRKDITAMVQQAETREEKAKLKKELIVMSNKEFKLKKKAQLAKKKAKADKK